MISKLGSPSSFIFAGRDEPNPGVLPNSFLTQKELDPDFISFNVNNRRVHFPRRTYLPYRALFLQYDPLWYKDGPNLFQYAHNNPVLFVDPLGLEVIVNIWEGAPQMWGHASIHIIPGDDNDMSNGYASFWPTGSYSGKDAKQDKKGGTPSPATSKTYLQDQLSEGNQLPNTRLRINGLNENAMKLEWQKMKLEMSAGKLKFEGLGSNCTTAVARILYAGMDPKNPPPCEAPCPDEETATLISPCWGFFPAKPGELPGIDRKINLENLINCINKWMPVIKNKVYICEIVKTYGFSKFE